MSQITSNHSFVGAQTIVGEPEVVEDLSNHPSWLALKDAASALRPWEIQDGSIPDADPLMLTHAMLGVPAELTRTMLHEAGRPAHEVADAAVAFCTGGLLGTRPATEHTT